MMQISLKRFKKILIKFFIDLLLYLSFKLVKILLNFIGFNNASLVGGYLFKKIGPVTKYHQICLLYTSPSPRDRTRSRMPSSA